MGGAAVLYSGTKSGKAPPKVDKTGEEKIQEQMDWEMRHTGIDAVTAQHLTNKHINGGGYGQFPESAGYYLRNGGYEPNQDIDPLEEVYERQHKLAAYDRYNTERGLHFAIPETRLDFKKTPIYAALTEEVHHPDNPEMVTNFRNDLQIPSYANERELKEAKRNMARHAQNGPSTMNYAEVEYLNRAPGQSFRYEQ